MNFSRLMEGDYHLQQVAEVGFKCHEYILTNIESSSWWSSNGSHNLMIWSSFRWTELVRKWFKSNDVAME